MWRRLSALLIVNFPLIVAFLLIVILVLMVIHILVIHILIFCLLAVHLFVVRSCTHNIFLWSEDCLDYS